MVRHVADEALRGHLGHLEHGEQTYANSGFEARLQGDLMTSLSGGSIHINHQHLKGSLQDG
jgi:hypothetical protein